MSGETILNGRYHLVAQQGSGGMSVIYKAIDRALGRTVAIKILRPSLTQDPAFLERFRNEARSVANLSHPNIVTVHDVGNEGATHYIVMEMVEGNDLKKIIKADGALPIDRVLHLGIQICAGIGYAHRSGIVHADVKPQNVLVTPQDVVKVTDFGIAQALSDTQPQQRAQVVWGSPHYFAPEQARGEQPSPASDVYAIGIVLFEMLTGRLPYTGTNQQELALAHLNDAIPMVTDFNPAIPESLARIVYKVMSKEEQGRYRTADQLMAVLQSFRDRARASTAPGIHIPPLPPESAAPASPPPPREAPVPTMPSPRPAPPPVSPPQGVPAVSAEPTVRYSPAPHAPQPYMPRPQGNLAAGMNPQPAAISSPQPFEQRYTPPPPRMPGDSSAVYSAQYSRAAVPDDDDGIDFVTIALAFLAFIAVAGLVPLYLAVIAARAG